MDTRFSGSWRLAAAERFTHFVVVDRDDGQVVAWFPQSEGDALDRAASLAHDTGNVVRSGYWDGARFVALHQTMCPVNVYGPDNPCRCPNFDALP